MNTNDNIFRIDHLLRIDHLHVKRTQAELGALQPDGHSSTTAQSRTLYRHFRPRMSGIPSTPGGEGHGPTGVQFDWSHEVVVLNGVTITVKVAHVRLCHSRMPFVRAYMMQQRWSDARR